MAINSGSVLVTVSAKTTNDMFSQSYTSSTSSNNSLTPFTNGLSTDPPVTITLTVKFDYSTFVGTGVSATPFTLTFHN